MMKAPIIKTFSNFILQNIWNGSPVKIAYEKFLVWLFCLISIWAILEGMHELIPCATVSCVILFITGALLLQSVKALFAFWRGIGFQWLGFWMIYLMYSCGIIQVAAPYSDINYIQGFAGAVLSLMWNQSNKQIKAISSLRSWMARRGIKVMWIGTGAVVQTWLIYPELFSLENNDQVICSLAVNLLILIFA